ncbi:MAG TPA: hypothetical protein VNO30_19650 [Kofleriaceae bacterium]|nr:hypothetical protein [Kofleriaceae bacterium]
MSKHRNPRQRLSKQPPTDNSDPDPRPHVAALRELSLLGWHVTEIRPDRALWRVTVTRYDGDATIGVTDHDPNEALDEVIRYAAVDAEEALPPVAAPEEGSSATDSADSAEPTARAEIVAQLEALGWELLDEPRRTATGWRATVRHGHVSMFAFMSTEQTALEDLLKRAQARAKEGR